MPVKYTCPKCNRRFTEWGAEKFGYKCPGDQWCPKDRPAEIELVRLGPSEDRPSRRPTLKKGARKLAVALPTYSDDTIAPDIDDLETAAEFQAEPEGFEEAEEDEETFDEEPVVEPLGVPGVVDDVVAVEEALTEDVDIDEAGAPEDIDETEEPIDEEWRD